jgi:hypothetical protein
VRRIAFAAVALALLAACAEESDDPRHHAEDGGGGGSAGAGGGTEDERVVLADGHDKPAGIVVIPSPEPTVYWVDTGVTNDAGGLFRVPAAGGASEWLHEIGLACEGPCSEHAPSLLRDGTAVYYQRLGIVSRHDAIEGDQGSFGFYDGAQLVGNAIEEGRLHGGHLYFSDFGNVFRVVVPPPSATLTPVELEALVYEPFVRAFELDDTFLYYAGETTIARIALTFFEGPHGTAPGEPIGATGGFAFDLVADGSTLYWSEQTSGAIRSMPKTGGNVTTLAEGLGGPTHLVLEASYLYFADAPPPGADGAASVNRVSAFGGAVEVLAGDLATVHGLAVDGEHVYFSTDDGKLWRAPKSTR